MRGLGAEWAAFYTRGRPGPMSKARGVVHMFAKAAAVRKRPSLGTGRVSVLRSAKGPGGRGLFGIWHAD